MTKIKTDNKLYKIRTFEDFGNVVNEENVDMFCGNFYGSMIQFLKFRKMRSSVKYIGFNWIDDGKIEMLSPKITIELAEDSEVLRDELELLVLSAMSRSLKSSMSAKNEDVGIAQSVVSQLFKNYNITEKIK